MPAPATANRSRAENIPRSGKADATGSAPERAVGVTWRHPAAARVDDRVPVSGRPGDFGFPVGQTTAWLFVVVVPAATRIDDARCSTARDNGGAIDVRWQL